MKPNDMRVMAIMEAHPEGLFPHEVVARLDPPVHRKAVAIILDRLVRADSLRRIGSMTRSRYAIVRNDGAQLAEAMKQWHKPPPFDPPDHSPL